MIWMISAKLSGYRIWIFTHLKLSVATAGLTLDQNGSNFYGGVYTTILHQMFREIGGRWKNDARQICLNSDWTNWKKDYSQDPVKHTLFGL